MTGRLFLVVGPSGAGKDTLLAGALAADPRRHWAGGVTPRQEGGGGEPFEGVDQAEFDCRLAQGDFALHWEAHGLRYGVPKAQLTALGEGRVVLVNGSRGAMAQAWAAYPDLRVIVITAPAEVLAERLAARGREGRAGVLARLSRAGLPPPEGVPGTGT